MKVIVAGFVAAALAGFAAAQCPLEASSPEFAIGPGPEGPISKVLAFDPDFAGPLQDDLMVIGDFSRVAGVAGYRGIARFDGSEWMPVPGIVATAPVYIRSGETIFVTSNTQMTSDGRNIGFAARFIPSINDWEPLDLNGAITTVQPYGADFLIGGNFTRAGGQNIEGYALLIDGEWSQPPRVAGTEKLLAVSEGRFVAYNRNRFSTPNPVWQYANGEWSSIPSPATAGGDLYAYQNELYYVLVQQIQMVVQVETLRFNGTQWVTAPRLPNYYGTDSRYQFRGTDNGSIQVRRAEDAYNTVPLCTITQYEYNNDHLFFLDYRGVLAAWGRGGFINGVSVGNLATIDPLNGCAAEPLTHGLNLSAKASFVTGADASAPVTMYEGRIEYSNPRFTESFVSPDGAGWGPIRSRVPDGWGEGTVHAYIENTLYITHRYFPNSRLTRYEGETPVDAFILPTGYYGVQLLTTNTNTYMVATADGANPQAWKLVSMGTDGLPDNWVPEFAPLPASSARLAILPTSTGDRAYSYHNTSTATVISRWNGSAWELAHTLPLLSFVRATVHENTLIVAGSIGWITDPPTLYQLDQLDIVTPVPSIPIDPLRINAGFAVTSAADSLFLIHSFRATPSTVSDTVWVRRGSGWLSLGTLDARPNGPTPSSRAFEDGLLVYSDINKLPNGEPTFRFAYFPAPVVCIADQNCDGGVDGSDIEAFFIKFDAGDPSADVNNDGGVDGADVQVFFEVWENGDLGCP